MAEDQKDPHASAADTATVPNDLVAMLDLLAQTIVQALGFGVAVVTLARSDGYLEVVSVAGDENARKVLLGNVDTAALWDQMLAVSEDWGRLHFRDHRHEQASVDSLNWVLDMEPIAAEDAWHPEDALFAPLTAADGSRLGVLSVDLPHGGRRPGPATCSALEAFAISAALAIEHATLRSQAEASERLYKQLATHDPLTGLGNRSLLLDRLRHASAARPGIRSAMALVFVDLDGFKAVNDRYSHEVGDYVLQTVAQRIQSTVRPHDTVARWGGDEFLVLLQDLDDEASGLRVVRRMSTAVAEPILHLGQELNLTASVGVAFRGATEEVDADELVRRADSAMYQVKRNGRNASAVFHSHDEPVSRRKHLADLVSRAVAEHRIVLHYQPIVSVGNEKVVGVEALLRLRDDDDTLVYPGAFLGLATENGLMIRLEHEVIRQACSQVANWVADGYDMRLSINICVKQLAAIEDFEQVLHRELSRSGLSPHRVVVELTEHALLNVTPETLAGVTRLVREGVRFSIDDFGTGFASMTYVHVMPVHELKVDRSFVAAAPGDPAARAIVRSIAALARDLEMGCVAEGVETVEQHELVRTSGVPFAQGYLYGRPAAPNVLVDMLAQRASRV